MTITLPVVKSCEGCGACCMHMRTPPHFPGTGEWRRLTKKMRSAIKSRVFTPLAKLPEDAPCLWLKDGKCKHYDLRPRICREFRMGSAACVVHRHDRGFERLTKAQEKLAMADRGRE